jgi:uncharacterized protein YlxW (UPF0749 family)
MKKIIAIIFLTAITAFAQQDTTLVKNRQTEILRLAEPLQGELKEIKAALYDLEQRAKQITVKLTDFQKEYLELEEQIRLQREKKK